MKWIEIGFAAGWIIASLWMFGSLMFGRRMNAVEGKPSGSVVLSLLFAAAAGVLWIPVGAIVLVKEIGRRRRRREQIALGIDPNLGKKIRSRFEENAHAEVERLQALAKQSKAKRKAIRKERRA